MNEREALKLALEALETCGCDEVGYGYNEVLTISAITAIKEALAQPERDLKPRCFADFQPNHEIDRKCQWCAVETECKTGMAQPEQEPVAWMYQEYRDDDQFGWRDEIQFVQPPNDPNYFRYIVPLYTTQPQRTWVGLTDEDVQAAWDEMKHYDDFDTYTEVIEAKLKEKNT